MPTDAESTPFDSTGREWADALPDGFGTLVAGALDLHVHGQPDLSRGLVNRGRDLGVATLARDYGLRGWVLKSHLFPTMDRAAAVQEHFDSDEFAVFGSITLNPPAGGLDGTVVDLAAAHGARVVFLPTWGARADVERGGYIADLLGRITPRMPVYAHANAITAIDGNGRLTAAADDVIEACRSNGLVLGTGHVSFAEILAVAERCAEKGVTVIATHPLHYVSSPAELQPLADLGAYIEFSGAPLLHPDNHGSIRDVFAAITELGPERVVLTSDVFSRWVPPEPECLRMFADQLAHLGASPADLRRMLADNPRTILGLPRGVAS